MFFIKYFQLFVPLYLPEHAINFLTAHAAAGFTIYPKIPKKRWHFLQYCVLTNMIPDAPNGLFLHSLSTAVPQISTVEVCDATMLIKEQKIGQ